MKKFLVAAGLAFFFITFPIFSQTQERSASNTPPVLYPPFSTKTPPVNTKLDSSEGCEEFFEQNYRATWDKLSEFEQYAIAFSSNFFQIHKQYHLDFSGKTIYNKNQDSPEKLLKDEWNVTDSQSLLETFDWLITEGHSARYKELAALFEKYPNTSVLDIALKEDLSILAVTRLYYIRDNGRSLGSHDIEAWDLGRAICIMRWGIASGYTTVEEATELCKPVVQKIRRDYVSWFDYLNHFVNGRAYFGLNDATSQTRAYTSFAAADVTKSYIPLKTLVFTGENADKEHEMKDYTYLASYMPDTTAWLAIQKLNDDEWNEETLKKLCAYEENEFSKYSDLFFTWHVSLLMDYGSSKDFVDYVEEHMSYFEAMDKEDGPYYNIMFYYLASLNQIFQPQKLILIYDTLPEAIQWNTHFFYLYAMANYYMINFATTQNELDVFKNLAIQAFMILKENDFDIGADVEGWLQAVN